MIIKESAYPRAALIGNPSDGYHGKTIAFVFRNYSADVTLYETPELELLPARRDYHVFKNMDALSDDVRVYGYYGGIRLLKAAVNSFNHYCRRNGIVPANRNFTMRYSSTIPNRLGLAGSSAIITAAMRALFKFYELEISPEHLANLVLFTERDELSIPAGLQDRVAQAYNVPVYMDFNKAYMDLHGTGLYQPITIPAELNLYVAYRTDLAEGSEILHSRLRDDYESGVPAVIDAMKEWAELTDELKKVLESGDFSRVPALLNRNFDLRCEVCRTAISAKNRQMVELARSAGASAKFTGSGGAIIGTYEDEAMFKRLIQVCTEHGIEVIKPQIVTEGNIG
ncbi:MAG: GHMP kinase [Lentisphaerae bacterium]|nr:GHMP kinase [Lentisphaerota bacterium]